MLGRTVLGVFALGFLAGCSGPVTSSQQLTVVAAPFEEGLAAAGRGDYAAAMKLLRPLADKGEANVQTIVGVMFESGGNGVPQDNWEAVRWYRIAAEQGYAPAQHRLGLMYDSGRGVPQNHEEAVRWYRRAADQGDAEAQVLLGLMFAKGEGVERDYVQAHMWLDIAASQPLEKRDLAVKARDLVASKMTRTQIANAQKLAREWKPVKN